MVDIRLLTVGLGIAIGVFGCGAVPRWSPELVGRVIDKQTGEPIPDVEVIASYEMNYFGKSAEFDFIWASTDVDGAFVLPGHFRERSPRWLATWKAVPVFRLVHSGYGFFWMDYDEGDYPGNRHLEFKITQSPDSLTFLDSPQGNWSWMCSGCNDVACDRICEVAYGSAEECR